MIPFRDYFSAQAAQYADFRPRYPDALFAWLARIAPARHRAWDCATGSGQAALGLAVHFDAVIASDASAAQLARAERHPRVSYCRSRAEQPALAARAFDLVTIAQALHWVERDVFFAQVEGILRAGGVFAAWCYGLVRITPEVDAAIDRFYHERLRGWWAPERRLVDERYRGITLPFAELDAPSFTMTFSWTRAHLAGYVRTWSATRALAAAEGGDPVLALERELARSWPDTEEERPARWSLDLRVGRVRV